MNIRTKVISLLALLFVTLIVVEIAIQRQVIMPSFAELERDDAKVSMKRISYALDMSLDGLEVTAADWGNWQDVYRYVQVPNEEFVRANITPIAMKQLQVNALMIADLRGEVVVSSTLDLVSGEHLDLDVASWKSLPPDFPWRQYLASGKPARGLIQTNHGPMMIAAAPVLDGTGSGRSLGMVIMGQLLTAVEVRSLGARAQVNLSMIPSSRSTPPEKVTETGGATQVERSFEDIYGNSLMTLRVELPRRITARGHNAVTYASAYLIGAAILVLVLLLIILNRVVLDPLARVTRHALVIGEGSDLTARLNFADNDEIGGLAREFDRMVARVEQSRRELVDQSFQSGFAELAKGVLHNLGNAMTPLAVRLSKLENRLRDMPIGDIEAAHAELTSEHAGTARHEELREFMRLGCREMAQAIEESQADVAVIQRQMRIVHTALGELMRSTHTEPVIESVRLTDLVTQTLEIVPDACRQRLTVDAGESLRRLGAVRVARTVLRLILQNLIINAADAVRDAGRDKGTLRVEAEIVREHERDQLHLLCADNGVGIAREHLERVFEKGFTTKSKDTNHGIGLHWCANAIAALGGRIWAASEGRGLGASLHLMLPLTIRET
ncbi:MAG TPA: CHASE4 domain-containing protein [Steroidobacteraceae bacterium]|nr:CHASE4 domain-containing protein [Steroidobacteraceae bacterium]